MPKTNLTDNILANKKFNIDDFNAVAIAKSVSKQLKERRLELNITQEVLAEKSGVSLGSIKRFENKAEISFKSLLMLAVVLNATNEFLNLFSRKNYKSIKEVVTATRVKTRKRASTHV